MTKPQFSSKKLPKSAAAVGAFRDAFGPEDAIIWIDENGYVYGTDERERDRRFREMEEK